MFIALLLSLATGLCADTGVDEAPRLERAAEWRAHKRLSTAGLALGYAAATAVFVVPTTDKGVATTTSSIGSVASFASTALVYGGIRGNADWLEERGTDVHRTAEQVFVPLGLAGGLGQTTGVGLALGASFETDEDGLFVDSRADDAGFLLIAGVVMDLNALGVGIAQLYVNRDALHRHLHPMTPGTPVPRRYAAAKGLAIAGVAMGWSGLPLWLFGFGNPLAVVGAGFMTLGSPLGAVGIAWERSILHGAGWSPTQAAGVLGYVMGPLGTSLMAADMIAGIAGSGTGTFVFGMALAPIGLGALTAQIIVNDATRKGGQTAALHDLRITPIAGRRGEGMAISGRF